MAEYYYDVNDEVFKRKDKRGNHLAINIAEAQQIVRYLDLGYNNSEISNKVAISNPKCGSTTVNSFIKNYKQGNIKMPVDAPAPVRLFESLTDSDRIEELERRVSILEAEKNNDNSVICECTKNSRWNKVKSWIK